MRVAFLIPAPDMEEPWRWAFDAEADALARAGIAVDPIVWTQTGDLSSYDLVLPLLVWGYHWRYGEWLRLLDHFEAEHLPVANPTAVLRWNSDKAYLAELNRKNVPSVPTIAVDALNTEILHDAAERFETAEFVVKPPVSAGAADTKRLVAGCGIPKELRDRPMLIQPFVESIASEGEYSLILFDGVLSHAVVKRPKRGDFRVQPQFGGTTEICEPPQGGEEIARAALAAAPSRCSYARVDLVRDEDGGLAVIELELVEPALFLHLVPAAEAAFARSVVAAAESAVKQPLA